MTMRGACLCKAVRFEAEPRERESHATGADFLATIAGEGADGTAADGQAAEGRP